MHTLKVLMIASWRDVHSLRQLNWLLDKGCRVVFSGASNPIPEGREGYGFLRYPYPRGEGVFPKLLGQEIGTWLSEWTSVARLKVISRRIRPAITHVHWVDDRAYHCVKAGLRPLVLTVWGSDINDQLLPGANPVRRRRVAQALANADLILVDSADMHEKCAALAGRKVPTELFHLGIKTDRFHAGYEQAALAWRHRLNIPSHATVLLSIRGWSPLYRHEDVLVAFAKALPRFDCEAVLVFKILERSSTDRALYEKEMRGLVDRLGIARKVRWMEEVPLDQLPEIYSFADAIVNYPSMDAFPVTFLEAAACECPVISCRLPAYVGTFAEEYFRLVSPHEISELSNAMVEFVNGDRAASRGRLAELRRIVCGDYDEKIASGRLMDIYQRLLRTP